jgi:hypothetical protein
MRGGGFGGFRGGFGGGFRGGFGRGFRGGFGGFRGGFGFRGSKNFRGGFRHVIIGRNRFFFGGFGYWPWGYGFPFGYGSWYPNDASFYSGYPYSGYSYPNYDYGYQDPSSQSPVVIYQTLAPTATPADYQAARPEIREYVEPPPQGYERPIFLIAFKGQDNIRAAEAFWVEGGILKYVNLQHERKQAPLESVDRALSMRLNRERNVDFRLPPAP